ncbi:SctK family type III secretion system sorting platform protein [Pleionea sp. CnH1-48]|uniref:SctK family type III secretion system sorting platform protein n=1 Tax=Pleionea sp. CnH1-48 TaxID=2954494 RepID=UPI00209852EA|nr:SctK family type III secretion system sorting platform protein [Pleionea sp. CnH1-48]MCO7227010.1 Yop proteins translocation protein K [Pleionea sp. CnH1-48]
MSQVHGSWLSHLEHPELVKSLVNQPVAHKFLSDYLNQSYPALEQHHYEFTDFFERCALLPAKALQVVIFYLGTAILSNPIRCTIEKQKVETAKAQLGEALYTFAIKQAPFTYRHLSELSKVHPEVGKIDWNEFKKEIFLRGCWMLRILYKDYPEALTQRLFMKLPYSMMNADIPESLESTPAIRNEVEKIALKLIQEKYRKWLPLIG